MKQNSNATTIYYYYHYYYYYYYYCQYRTDELHPQTGAGGGSPGSRVAPCMHGQPLRSMYMRSQSGHWVEVCSGSERARSSDVGMAAPGLVRVRSGSGLGLRLG